MVSWPLCGETNDPQTTDGVVAPCPLSKDVTVAAVLCPGTSRSQRGLLSPPVLPLRLQEEPGSGVPHQCSGPKEALVNAGLLLISMLEPEDEADSDYAGWYNRASHSDTGRWETGTRPQSVRCLFLENCQILNKFP